MADETECAPDAEKALAEGYVTGLQERGYTRYVVLGMKVAENPDDGWEVIPCATFDDDALVIAALGVADRLVRASGLYDPRNVH